MKRLTKEQIEVFVNNLRESLWKSEETQAASNLEYCDGPTGKLWTGWINYSFRIHILEKTPQEKLDIALAALRYLSTSHNVAKAAIQEIERGAK